MPNRLATAISPYLRSHADNPVDWYGWGPEAFAEAARRDVPVLVSIGYSTCHWCHVMARESFSDPALAEYLNDNFVSIKVDREEHPDVDASYLAAASAFTAELGWPLNVFVTPTGQAFFAGTYFPPRPMQGHPAFRQVLDAVVETWATQREAVLASADQIATALAEAAAQLGASSAPLPTDEELQNAVSELVAYEDTTHGGFDGAPKFPVAPTLGFLLQHPGSGQQLALRTLKRMGASPLRDPVEGGFFRYAVRADWSEPHYERMLYDNAQLLDLYTRAWQLTGDQWARIVATGVARFLTEVMRLPGGGFASAQDSESAVNGQRTEGGYYALEAEDRAEQTPPARDEKVLTGWNGLAIGALANAGFAFADAALIDAASAAADFVLEHHLGSDQQLARASIDNRLSSARATLEDYGMFANGLLDLAMATGQVHYADTARSLVDSTLDADLRFRVPGGADPILAAQGLAVQIDPSEGAYPSGISATADAARRLFELTGERRYREAAERAMSVLAPFAPERPLAFGAALAVMTQLTEPGRQLVVVSPDAGSAVSDPHGLVASIRMSVGVTVRVIVTDAQAALWADAGFELCAGRTSLRGLPTAYLCHDFVCRLPVTDPDGLARGLATAVGDSTIE
ncbi:thioredoxin domain-containing protein [Leifsonia sp. A12D58]|uniref:thioredoxin domain-containing protein n=1 Tax=Leifsonia sp. A12D58 TaxID=3397674 RepID=UPI0039E0C80F